MTWLSFPTGFGVCASLIAAIGAQNAFLLRQAVRGEHVIPLVVMFAACDALLVTAGVTGGAALLGATPWLLPVVRWTGAGFLAAYGVLALRRAAHPGALVAATGRRPASRRAVMLTGLAFTLLNPHVYLDTVLLIGSIGAAQPDGGKIPFVLGASSASAAWFALIGIAGQRLAPLMARPAVWRGLELTTAGIMFVTACALARP
jgi:L-lysine exporter family protein LysE/ArgO